MLGVGDYELRKIDTFIQTVVCDRRRQTEEEENNKQQQQQHPETYNVPSRRKNITAQQNNVNTMNMLLLF